MALKYYIAGHKGMVGSAIERLVKKSGKNIELITYGHKELELTNQEAVSAFFKKEKPDKVILAAAKVGGIYANNTYPAEFIYENLMIQSNVIHQAHMNDVQDLLFLGSSCIYPHLIKQPMQENTLLTGTLEPTNEPYAVAKIAGIKMCESYNRQYSRNYRTIMPTNLYGPGDNFSFENSHVIPAMIRKFHEAKLSGSDYVTIWGSGMPRREFLHVNDMAEASLFILNLPHDVYKKNTDIQLSHINVGSGEEVSILQLAKIIAKVIGYNGQIKTDITKPDGSKRKLMDTSRLSKMGWKSKINLKSGIENTYNWFLHNFSNIRRK